MASRKVPLPKLIKGRYEVNVCVLGQRVHRRLPEGTSARDAKQYESDLRASLGRREASIPGDPLLTELMAGYMIHAETLRDPKPAKYAALRIGAWLVGRYASHARQTGMAIKQDMAGAYAPGTINKSLGTLKKALSLAYDRGTIPQNYGDQIKILPENNIRLTTITLDQVRLLADAASHNVRVAIWVAIYTGCRRGEICAIKAGDIGDDVITLEAGMTKTQRHRMIPIIPPLRPWLAFLPLQISAKGIEGGFRNARIKAGLPDITFHDLRRSCATMMLASGVPMHVISKLLGHSSTRITESRYAHMQVDAVRAGLESAFAPKQANRKHAGRAAP